MFGQCPRNGCEADAIDIVKYLMVHHNSSLNFMQFYCIICNNHFFNGKLLIIIEELSSSPRGWKMLEFFRGTKKSTYALLYDHIDMSSENRNNPCKMKYLPVGLLKDAYNGGNR